MVKLQRVDLVKKEVNKLNEFIRLAEEYPERTLEERILKFYAYSGTLKATTRIINEENIKLKLPTVEDSYVREVIQSKPTDSLHKMLRSSYMLKTRNQRNR